MMLCSHDLQTFTLGRPSFFQNCDTDCELPVDTAAVVADSGKLIESGESPFAFEQQANAKVYDP